ncbi:hypothetical protein [Algoriphagus algorifonticola]|uniref:hypothetical protein n=1 Tax=Algoriphagus algorifonticola TaxID=2593007 RepID=UPI0011A94CF8|nr:hypothetical protein [Algoriphagus algorifonticola]
MKILFYVLICFVAAGFFGCQDSDGPRNPLLGTWENRSYVDSLDVWFVHSLTIKNDSLMEVKNFARKSETGPIIGYHSIADSWYNYQENRFTYYYSEGLFYFNGNKDTYVASRYGPKESLKPGILDFFRIPEGELIFSADGQSFEFQEDCWSINADEECVEFSPMTYILVN